MTISIENGVAVGQRVALYESHDRTVHLDVRMDEDTVWLTQQQLAALFGRSVPTISRHIANALHEELDGFPVVANMQQLPPMARHIRSTITTST